MSKFGNNQITKTFSNHYSSNKVVNKNLSKIIVGDKELAVEVVREEIDLKNGLSNRDQIGSEGMLFILPFRRKVSFWMKDMRFPLDMIWIKDGKVVEITKDVSPPTREYNDDSSLILYSPQEDVDQVLEVMAGNSDQWGISVGDTIVSIE